MYDAPVDDDDGDVAGGVGTVPLVPVGVPAAVPAWVGVGFVASSVDPGVAAALDDEAPPVMAFVSRNPFCIEPLAADELMFWTQPVTVIVLSAAAVAGVALAPS
jgi:hypothetical protein